ncbi:S-layer family protein [Candidatus Obscuribacterales bacterium]|nr:S-layer family protein [Candidatus Obscuribacterales bacterium]
MNPQSSGTPTHNMLGASLLACLLSLVGSAAQANSSRGEDLSIGLSAREALKLDRHEARLERRESRIERALGKDSSSFAQMQRPSNVQFARPNGARQHNELRGMSGVSSSLRRAELSGLPGQISPFSTSRPTTGRSTFDTERGNSKLINRGLSLDLSSTKANITLGENLFDGTVTLVIAGEERQFSAGSKATPAEFAAINQKLATGDQSLTLSVGGAASGGSLNLNLVSDNGSTIKASELVVPQNVTVEGDFGRTADGVRVNKDLVNYGSIVASSASGVRNTAVIGARDIVNAEGGSIVSVSSPSNPNLNLALRAARDLTNSGEINSSGDLELAAGRAITNVSKGVIGADGNVLFNAPSINNQGMVIGQSDITFAGPSTEALTINNFGGTVSAQNGSINLRETDYIGTGNSIIYGGDLLSKQLNINAGQATGDVVANDVTGTVNSSGLAAHVSVDTDTLVLGTQCLTGDPTYYNTGDILINGSISVAEDLTIIAGRDISSVFGITLVAVDGAGAGKDITLIAGANITAGSGQLPPAGGPANLASGAQQALSNVTVSGASATGGNIVLGSSNYISSQSNLVTNEDGGDVTLIAYSNGNSRGQIGPNSIVIEAHGHGSGNNGNVTIIGQGSVSIGQIFSYEGNGTAPGTGTVLVAVAPPTTSDGLPITYATDGSIASGNRFVPVNSPGNLNAQVLLGPVLASGNVSIIGSYDIVLGTVASYSGDISLQTDNGRLFFNTGAILTADSISAYSSGIQNVAGTFNANQVQLKSGSNITFDQTTINADSVTLLSNQNLVLSNSTINAREGLLAVAGQSITGDAGEWSHLNGSTSGDAANIALFAGASWTDNGATVTIGGSSATGGSIVGDSLQTITTSSTGGGSAGAITMVAFAQPSNSTSGRVTPQAVTEITAKGSGGLNGDVTIVADGTGNSIIVDSIDVTGGTAGGAITLSVTNPNVGSVSPITKSDATYSGSFAGSAQGAGAIQVLGELKGNQISLNAGTNSITATNVTASGLSGNQDGGSISITGGTVSVDNLIANGFGSGNGGDINISANTLTAVQFTADGGSSGSGGQGGSVQVNINSASQYIVGQISANGGGVTGGAGSIIVRNTGSGGISLTPSNISLLTGGAGGSLTLDATSGAVDGPIAIMGSSINVNGNAGFNNGQIFLSGSTITSSGALSLTAVNGLDHTGVIELAATTGNIAIAGNFSASSGSAITVNTNQSITTSGTGGSVLLQSMDGLNAATANIITSSGSPAVAGGAITINGSIGNYNIGNLSSLGTASQSGGNISLTSDTGSFNVGNISADGGSSGGGGGSLTITSNAASINLKSISLKGFGSASGGDMDLSSNSGGDIIFGVNSTVVSDSSATGGNIQISTGTGSVVFQGGTSSISAKGGTANGSISFGQVGMLDLGSTDLTIANNGVGSGSSIDFSSALPGGSISSTGGSLSVNASGSVNFTNMNGGITTGGGDVSLSATSISNDGLAQSAPSIDASVSGVGLGGDISFTVNSNLTTNSLKGNDITISLPTLTQLSLNSSVDAQGTVIINTGRVVQTAAQTIKSDALQLNLSTPGMLTTLETNVNSVTIGGANNSVSIVESNDLSILSINNVSDVNITAAGGITVDAAQNSIVNYTISAGGLLSINAPISTSNSISLTSTNSDVQLGDALTVGSAGVITLETTNGGQIQETASGSINTGSGGLLSVKLLGVSSGNATLSGSNSVYSLTGSGGGLITLDNAANALQILGLGSTQSLNATTTDDAMGISLAGPISTSGTVTFNTPLFVAGSNNLSAASITVQSTASLTVDSNGATLTGTTPPAGSPGNPSTPTAINFITANGEVLTLVGTMNFGGDVTLRNSGGTTVSQNNSLYAGSNNVVLITANWMQQGNGNITGNILFPGGVSIVNPDGDLVLAGNLKFDGQDLVLAAKNNVILGNFNIDLSSSTGDGSDLIILAGYTLTPTGGGQQQTSLPYTIGAPTVGGGSISGTGTITTTSTALGGNGGDVTILTTGTGTISLNNIDASATDGRGGTIYLIGAGVTANEITSTGSARAGDVYIGGIDSIPVPDNPMIPMVIQNGKVTGGTFDLGNNHVGPISVKEINADSGFITLNNRGANTTIDGTISAIKVFAYTDELAFTTVNSLSVNPDAAGNGGEIRIEVGSVKGATTAPFELRADGVGTGDGGTINVRSLTTNTFIGTPAKAPKGSFTLLSASATSGASGGNGGIISIFSDVSLTVDTDFINASPLSTTGNWNGASYALGSGAAKGAVLQVSGDLRADNVGSGTGGQIYLLSFNSKAFTVNATKLPKFGTTGELSAGASGSIIVENVFGGVTIASNFVDDPGSLILGAGGKGSISTGKGVSLSAVSYISLASETGAIGKKPLMVAAPELTLISQGSVNVQSTYTGGALSLIAPVTKAGKSLTLSALSDVLIVDSMDVMGDIDISTTGAIVVDNTIVTQSGSIALTAGSGTLDVGSNITANNGGIVLANRDTVNGDVNIGAVTVATAGKGDDVVIAIGAPPKKGTNTQAEPGFTVNPHGTKGVAYFGPAGGVVTPGTVDVNVINKDVIFNNLSTGGKLITVAGGATITADPPSRLGGSVATVSTTVSSHESSPDSSLISIPSNGNPENTSMLIGSLTFDPSLRLSTSTQLSGTGAASKLTDNAWDRTGLTGGSLLNLSENRTAPHEPEDLKVDAVLCRLASDSAQEDRNFVFAPTSDITVKTKHGTVSIKAGSVALIMQSESVLSVYDLHDECKNAVTIRSGNAQLNLTPGRHVSISNQSQADFVDVNAVELVQYRGINRSQLQNGLTVYTSEFSIPSACYAVKPLAKLFGSKAPDARKLTNRLLKTTSVVMTLNPDRGDFIQYFKPRVAAMK